MEGRAISIAGQFVRFRQLLVHFSERDVEVSGFEEPATCRGTQDGDRIIRALLAQVQTRQRHVGPTEVAPDISESTLERGDRVQIVASGRKQQPANEMMLVSRSEHERALAIAFEAIGQRSKTAGVAACV